MNYGMKPLMPTPEQAPAAIGWGANARVPATDGEMTRNSCAQQA
jgi:hypothetical protein